MFDGPCPEVFKYLPVMCTIQNTLELNIMLKNTQNQAVADMRQAAFEASADNFKVSYQYFKTLLLEQKSELQRLLIAKIKYV